MIQEMLASTPPIDALTDLTNRNLELWQEMQDQFLAAAGLKPSADRSKDDKGRE